MCLVDGKFTDQNSRCKDLFKSWIYKVFLKSNQVLHVFFSMHKNFLQNEITWKVKMLQISRLVIYRPVCKIQASHVTNLMTLKALSIFYFYLSLDFEAFDTMFLRCFPWICKLHVLVCKLSLRLLSDPWSMLVCLYLMFHPCSTFPV